MRVQICAVGRMRASPERELFDTYSDRFNKTGRALGLGPLGLSEVEAKTSNMAEEAKLLTRAIPDAAFVMTLDERGSVWDSVTFSQKLAAWRDDGNRDLAIIIGGADGIDRDIRKSAHASLSFGKMVWPHMLARVMLAEQLYRAASILAGKPYHRV